jgi:hypothetical protein
VDLAEGVANLVDDEGEGAVGAMAEMDRERIESITEQSRVAQKLDPTAGEVDVVLGAWQPRDGRTAR